MTCAPWPSTFNYWEAYNRYRAEVEMLHGLFTVKDDAVDLWKETWTAINAAANSEGIGGVPTPWPRLNAFSGGFQPGSLCYIGAPTGNGKTSFMLQCAQHAVKNGYNAVFFTMGDMTSIQLARKLVGMETGIPGKKLQNGPMGKVELDLVTLAIEQLHELPLNIVDVRGCAPRAGAIRDYVRRLHDQGRADIIFVDYIQQIQGDGSYGGSYVRELGDVSRTLLLTAKGLNIPVVAASQLRRQEGEPKLNHLRDSGNLEIDADDVYLLYRPTKDGITYDDERGLSLEYITKVIAAKSRVAGEEVPKDFWLRFEAGSLVEADKFYDGDPAPPQSKTNGKEYGAMMTNYGAVIAQPPTIPASHAKKNDDDDIPF